VRPQQLPAHFCLPHSLTACGSRKLASLFADGRLLTLDMQPEEDEDN
jgi:hypothetical protein